jgi:hypothetical protein
MNTLTKHELDICETGIGWLIGECSFTDNQEEVKEWEKIRLKLKSLVDNYDENTTLTDEQLKQAQADDYIAPPEL